MRSTIGLTALSPSSIPNRGFTEDAYKQYQSVLATTSYFNSAIAESTAFYSRESLLEISELGDLPLIELSHGLPDTTGGNDGVEQSQFEQEWTKMQTELAGLSSKGKQHKVIW